MIKNIGKKSRWLLCAALFTIHYSLFTTSCGKLFEVEELGDDLMAVAELSLTRHTVDLMVGDEFLLAADITPDTLAASGIYWESADTTVVRISGERLTAIGPGETTVTAIALAGLKSDTCRIRVLDRWVLDPYAFIYDMVIYADVSVNGRAADDDTLVGAFGIDADGHTQLKGLGSLRHSPDGRQYMVLRTYSNAADGENLSLRCYDRSRALLLESPTTLVFKSNATLGTLSRLYTIVFE